MTERQERRVVRADRATRAFVVFILTYIVLSLGLLTVTSYQLNERGKDNRKTLEQIATINNGRTQAVADVDQVVLLAAACAVDKHGSELKVEAAIHRCVLHRLAIEKGTP